MQANSAESWNDAARRVYGSDSLDAMEATWLDSLKSTNPNRVAARGMLNGLKNGGNPAPTSIPRNDTRSSAAPAVPVLEPPVTFRGTAPDNDRPAYGRGPAPTAYTAGGSPAARPYVPDRPPPVLMPPELPRR